MTCPDGHPTTETTHCGECGKALVPARAWTCPRGHGERSARFCEVCGYDSHHPAEEQAQPAGGWQLTASADRDYFAVVRGLGGPDLAELEFPQFWAERRFALRGEDMLVGRRDLDNGFDPEIDLGADRAVGRAHAKLLATPQGWSVVDLRSVNGTYVNDTSAPIRPETPVPLRDGDRVYLGAWTRLTLRAR
ncbi:FHA domain-containing protein [Actinokineospora sp. 24-640]